MAQGSAQHFERDKPEREDIHRRLCEGLDTQRHGLGHLGRRVLGSVVADGLTLHAVRIEVAKLPHLPDVYSWR